MNKVFDLLSILPPVRMRSRRTAHYSQNKLDLDFDESIENPIECSTTETFFKYFSFAVHSWNWP